MSLMSQWFFEARIIVNCPNPTVYIYMTLNSGMIRSNSSFFSVNLFSTVALLLPSTFFIFLMSPRETLRLCEYDLMCMITSRVLDCQRYIYKYSAVRLYRHFFVISISRFNWFWVFDSSLSGGYVSRKVRASMWFMRTSAAGFPCLSFVPAYSANFFYCAHLSPIV